MKRIKKILIIIIVISTIFPLVHFYLHLFPPRIIPEDYKKYGLTPAEFAITKLLSEKIVENAKKRNLKGYVSSLSKISGEEDIDILQLQKDINLALGQYNGWKVVAAEEQLQELKKRKETDIARKRKLIDAGFLDPESYTRFLIQSERITINYDVIAEWSWLPASKENCYLKVTVLNRSTGEVEFSEKVSFTHPRYFRRYKLFENTVVYGSYVSSVSFFISLMFLLIIELKQKIEILNKKKMLPEIYQKIDNYVSEGSYVAADELINSWLEVFPKNTDLKAKKENLMMITKNNPSVAQWAYCRWTSFFAERINKIVNSELLKLLSEISQDYSEKNSRLEEVEEILKKEKINLEKLKSLLLSEEEYEELKKLKECLELKELNEDFYKYELVLKRYRIALNLYNEKERWYNEEKRKLKEKKEKIEKIFQEVQEISYLINQGEIKKAKEKKESIALRYSAILSPEIKALTEHQNIDFDEISQKLNEIEKESEILYKEALTKINSGEISLAEEMLKKAYAKNKDLKEAKEILDKIEISKKQPAICLEPQRIGKKIYMFKNIEVITFFRKDKKIPTINIDRKEISRDRHLKLFIANNKLLAEDEGSTNGSYVCGKKLFPGNPEEIEDGDIINLAQVYNMTIHIFKRKDYICFPTTVPSTISPDIQIPSSINETQQKIDTIFIETEDKHIIIFVGEKSFLPINFKTTGIEYEKASKFYLGVDNGVFFLNGPEKVHILLPGEKVKELGLDYEVKQY
jgi:hypothetical protein